MQIPSEQPRFDRFQTILSRGFQLLIIVVIVLSITGYLGQFNMYLDLTSHFKVQYGVTGGLALIFFALKRQGIWTFLSLVCVMINLWAIVPWYIPSSFLGSDTTTPLRVLLANVNVNNHNHNPLVSLIQNEQPDVIVLTEVDSEWIEALEPIQAHYPYQLISPIIGQFGNLIYSQYPLGTDEVQYFETIEIPSIVTTITVDEVPIKAIAIHPPPPITPTLFAARNQELDRVSHYVQTLSLPTLVLGDFNISLWSPFYTLFQQVSGLKNSRQGFGILPTWHTQFPLFYIPLDHCFVSPSLEVTHIKTLRSIASDHLPVLIELGIPKA